MGRGLYCKLPTNGKQLPAFPLEVGTGFELGSQRWEVGVLPLSIIAYEFNDKKIHDPELVVGMLQISNVKICKFAITCESPHTS